MSGNRILMCAPTYFDVFYSINPWMKQGAKVDKALARKQWENVRTAVQKAGATVFTLEPPESSARLPDIVFSANAAVVRGRTAYMVHMLNKERRGERPFYEKWFKDNGYTVLGHDDLPFEGAADADFCGGFDTHRLYATHGVRTVEAAQRRVAEKLAKVNDENGNRLNAIKLILLKLVMEKWYHLDACFCPVSAHQALVHPPAFDAASLTKLKHDFELIEVDEAEANAFGCNAVVVGKNIVMPTHTDTVANKLAKKGFNVQQVDVGEFLKSGGACKCMTLRV